ncbi:beta-ketoacyl-[acyl-carrier-protein] synthase family protein [Nocardia crassostreae]|uniref:beta-ketoacyl-[acyl-carrier-protein] synthase family protein n=1 Tax=Nocardia crassostreae TaxID=53428 RepID=UPI0008310488|nr:beta-ketoacyl-[acyl-carrier-protein] synthase family protein [Nocardia crassostreae]
MRSRVVITGIGPVAPIGVGVDSFATALRTGASSLGRVRRVDGSRMPHNTVSEFGDVDPADHVTVIDPDEWGPASVAAAAAARLAVDDAGLDRAALRRGRAGSAIGTTCGESGLIEIACQQEVDAGRDAVGADLVRKVPTYRLGVAVNRELGLNGETMTLASACAASNFALGYAYDAVSCGDATFMIAGGVDLVTLYTMAGFYRLGTLAKDACSPFDVNRQGIILGEGACAVVVESLDSALARGADIYAEVLGYGVNCDAGSPIAPDPSGIAECIRRAHHHAGVKPGDVDYVCAHGTGTPANDVAETTALRAVFGETVPPVSSIKSMLGHTLGAASGFGVIAACLAVRDGFILPTINLDSVDPEFADLDLVANSARDADVRIVQNNGFAFGGNNAITIIGRYE